MKPLRLITMLLVACFILSCNTDKTAKTDGDKTSTQKDKKSAARTDELIICLQPFDNFTEKEAAKVTKELAPALSKIFPDMKWHFEVLPNKPLPKEAYVKPLNRYRASDLLKHLKTTKDKYLLGLTHRDICYNIHGYENYGIRGLTPIGGNNSIISDHRGKGNVFIMVIAHEFLHGYSRAPHCKNPDCLMCDHQFRKGKPMKVYLCKEHEYIYQHNE